METVHTPQVLILACGALATEIRDIARLHRLGNVTLECLPGILHNRPTEIPDAVRARLDRARGDYDRVLLGYGDCGTAGELADIAAQEGIEMLPGRTATSSSRGSRCSTPCTTRTRPPFISPTTS